MRSSIRVQTDLTAAHESLTDNGIHAPTYPGRQDSAFQSGKERDSASTPTRQMRTMWWCWSCR